MESALRPSLTLHAATDEHMYAEHACAEEALVEHINQLEAMRAVTEEITQELDLSVLLRLITQKAVELVGAAVSGAVFLWDEATQVLIPQAWHGYGEWLREVRLRLGEAIVGAVAQRRVGLLVNDYQTSPYVHPLFVEHTGATAILAEPLLYHNRLVGVIVLNNGSTGEGFTTQDHKLLTIFGAHAALSIERARLYETLEIRLRRLQTLTHLNQIISSSLHMDDVLHEIARAAATLMNAQLVSFWLVDESTRTLEVCTFSDEVMGANFPVRQLTYSQGGVGWVATHRHLLNVPDIFADARFVARDWWRAHNLYSFLALPVIHNDSLLAVLALNGAQPFHLSSDHQYILESFVTQTAIAIQNARLFAEVRTQTAQLEQANAELQCEIIERQQAEAALRQARDELETRIAERTTEIHLANVQLRQEITERNRTEETLQTFATQLQRSNRELQDFAYTASHDLQEPLRKILTFGDRLKAKCGETLGEQGRDYLERMQNAAQRMQTLINDLLAFSRVTTKAQPFVSVDLAQVASEVVTDLEVRIEQTGGQVDIDKLPTIEADPLQMRQLFQNLISNALKFHQQGVAPIVTVQGHLLQNEDWHLTGNAPVRTLCKITVADNGIGFDEKYLDRIFNVFQRLHSRSAYEGAGVGLAVCRKIVERHSGSITARSTPGQGTTFIITLPIAHPKGTEAHV
jgi:signal transduction histidine kinase